MDGRNPTLQDPSPRRRTTGNDCTERDEPEIGHLISFSPTHMRIEATLNQLSRSCMSVWHTCAKDRHRIWVHFVRPHRISKYRHTKHTHSCTHTHTLIHTHTNKTIIKITIEKAMNLRWGWNMKELQGHERNYSKEIEMIKHLCVKFQKSSNILH